VADKFRQVAALLASARKLGWIEALAAGGPVRECWARLRRKYRAWPPDLTPLLAVSAPVTCCVTAFSKYMADVYLDICFTKTAHHD
jgi:hypothetical protein